ncbi:MAG: hypothetical protein K6B13_03030 [Prevotella sp.]|nr:hypothetical protein [Prevotella sp.]
MSVSGQWQWQESGKAWKGVGIYHVTLSVASREPLLGVLVIPENDPAQAHVERTELGRLLLECQRSIAVFHPEIQILQYCLMPDHLHSIWYVRRPMEKGIRYAVQAFWRAAKKLGRGYTFLHSRPVVPPPSKPESASPSLPPSPSLSSIAPAGSRDNPPSASPSPSLSSIAPAESRDDPLPASLSPSLSSIAPAESRDNPLREMLGGEAYSRLAPVFTEMPFIRPMSRRGQLQTMIRYVQLNPQRLATKRLMPGFFRVQKGIVIAGRTYAAVGNAALLMAQRYATVHVRQAMVTAAEQGDTQPLRNYMNGCVLKARQGTVMVSPFISPKEKAVMNVLLSEQHPFIFLADNGFRDYYKPSGVLFDAVAAGRVLILSPWDYDAGKRHITRADCVALNAMAEEIASLSDEEPNDPKQD